MIRPTLIRDILKVGPRYNTYKILDILPSCNLCTVMLQYIYSSFLTFLEASSRLQISTLTYVLGHAYLLTVENF